MGNIEINRDISENQLAIYKALELLKRNKTILIFPEGRLEDKKGKLLEFTKTFAFLSLKTGRPIIPYYIDGEYGIFKSAFLLSIVRSLFHLVLLPQKVIKILFLCSNVNLCKIWRE